MYVYTKRDEGKRVREVYQPQIKYLLNLGYKNELQIVANIFTFI